MSWCRAPLGAHDQIVVKCLTVAVLSCSCALSDERSGLSFDYEDDIFWDIRTQFVPHRKHYVSATEPSQ
jgi:hypothetical protein